MEYFSESARALVARAIALSGGGELLPEHLMLACGAGAVAETSVGGTETFFGEQILKLFAEAYQMARRDGLALLEESHLRRVLRPEELWKGPADPEKEKTSWRDLTLADAWDGSVERALRAEGLDPEPIRQVATTIILEDAMARARATAHLNEPGGSPFFSLVSVCESEAFAQVGLTRELCERLLRPPVPVKLGVAEKLIQHLDIPFEAGESGRAALFVAWMLSKRREIGVERLLQGTLAADLLLTRSGGAADRVREVGFGAVLTQLPTVVGLHAEGESFPLQLSPEADGVVRRCRAGFESEDLLTELLSEDCWEALGSEFVALRDKLR